MDQLSTSTPARDALPRTIEEYEARCASFSHLSLRTFEVRSDGEWRNAGWLLCARMAGETDEDRAREYADVRMRAVTLPRGEFRGVVEGALARREVAGLPAPDVSKSSVDLRAMSIHNGFGHRPGRIWDIGQDVRQAIPFWKRLVSFEEPFYESAVDAYAEWFRIPGWHGSADARIGHAFIYIPETRAWLSEFLLGEESLRVRVDRESGYASALRLKGVVGPYGRAELVDHDVPADGLVDLPLPRDSDTLELLLVADDDSVLCWHSETSQFVNGRRALATFPEAPEPAEVTSLIRGGESHEVEFKPFVHPEDTKFDELFRVICSFANSRGGTLLLGVEDDATVTGIEQGLCAWGKSPAEAALAKYTSLMERRVGDRIDPRPAMRLREHVVQDHTVLAVRVEQSVQRPLTLDGDIYLRVAATSRRALGTEIHSMLTGAVAASDAAGTDPWSGAPTGLPGLRAGRRQR